MIGARSATAIVMASLVGVGGCDGLTGQAGDRPEGFRFVEGTLQIPEDDLFGRQVTGLQVAALHLTAEGGVVAFPSAVFDPSQQRAEASFVATVRNDLDVVLILQVPSSSQQGAGSLLGQYTFGGETLVPRGEQDLDLGLISITRGARVPADTTLTSGAGNSPAAQTDTDGDGLTNDNDDDDDDDGAADFNDADVAGDGVDDSLQVLLALPDDDADGVPNVLE